MLTPEVVETVRLSPHRLPVSLPRPSPRRGHRRRAPARRRLSAHSTTRPRRDGTTGPDGTSTMDAALAAGRVGALNVLVPNDCDNGHGARACEGGARVPIFH